MASDTIYYGDHSITFYTLDGEESRVAGTPWT